MWKQRNELLIHDVTCVKYNKEDNIFSHYLTFFQRLSKKMKKKNENKEPKVALISLQDKHFVITIVHNFVGHIKLDTYDVRIQLYWECTNSRCHLFYYLFGLYLFLSILKADNMKLKMSFEDKTDPEHRDSTQRR